MPALIGTMMIFSESRGLKKRCGESADRRGSLRDGSNPKSNMKSTIGAPISASSSNASVRDAAKKRCFTDPLRYVTGFQAGSTQSRKNRARQRGAVRFPCCIHKKRPKRKWPLVCIRQFTPCPVFHSLHAEGPRQVGSFISIRSVPTTMSTRPRAAFLDRCSLNTSAEKPIETKMLSLSIGTTTLARPSCSAL